MKHFISGVKHFVSSCIIELRSIYWNILPPKWITLEVIKNEKFEFLKKGAITKILFYTQHLVSRQRSFEYSTLNRFYSEIKSGYTVLDIGGNIGLFTLLASSKVGKEGKIISFEPNPSVAQIMRENVNKNEISNVRIEEIALSNANGEISLNILRKEFSDLYSFISNSKNVEGLSESITVKMTRLDDFILENSIGKIDIIKIDIEGAEFMCFEGAKKTLTNDKPIIIFECNESINIQRFGYNTFELLSFLYQFGYSFEEIERHQWIASIKRDI
jgi:FkbM family methyltransferase